MKDDFKSQNLDEWLASKAAEEWAYLEGVKARKAAIPHHGAAFHHVSKPEVTDAQRRKDTPVFSSVLRYFPDALAEIARLCKAGNDQHNPGKPLHWARSKSGDELDALTRHLLAAGSVDTDGFYHDVKVAWRALANLQKLIEQRDGLPISPGSRA